MKIPMSPPKSQLSKLFETLSIVYELYSPTTPKGEYIHWDKLRHLKRPEDVTAEKWWLTIKLARRSLYKKLPFKDKDQKAFVIATPDNVLYKLHIIDRNTGNTIQPPPPMLNTNLRDSYLVQSLIEEAITSSQLEGASTTKQVAKEMLKSQRKPRDHSEKMIFNNYQAMQFVREIKDEALTVEMIVELHRIITQETLDEEDLSGCLRKTDNVYVYDNTTSQILHVPPKASELKKRLEKLCKFANANKDEDDFFIHPIIKAILLHFMLAYDHPFVDGNGRTARALFYWSMAHQNYWLMEFISISEIIKQSPSKYARAYLYTETDENDVTYFIIHQLDAIIQAITRLHDYIKKQSQEITEVENLLHRNQTYQNKLNYRQLSLIKDALKHPNSIYQITSHRQTHHVTYDTARTDLLNLAKFGLLIKLKLGKAFTFMAPPDLRKKLNS